MTPDQFRAALETLGWNQTEFAQRVGRHPNKISEWMTGKTKQVPKWAEAYLGLALTIKRLAERLNSAIM